MEYDFSVLPENDGPLCFLYACFSLPWTACIDFFANAQHCGNAISQLMSVIITINKVKNSGSGQLQRGCTDKMDFHKWSHEPSEVR